MSLLHPPPGFPPQLAVFWPLIWAQILVLRAWVRGTYGKGTLYRWSVTPYGLVYVVSIEWVPGQDDGPAYLAYAARATARIAAAIDGRAFAPEHIRNPIPGAHPNPITGAHPGARRDPERQGQHMRLLDPGVRRGERLSEGLPLPDS